MFPNIEPLGDPLQRIDWAIIAVFVAVSVAMAMIMRGRLSSPREFFLANRELPWIIVCISLISTEISAAGYVGVPQTAFSVGGSLTYIQLAIGAILARFIIGYGIIPAYYQADVYSPYQFIGKRLGRGPERMTAILFVTGAILGQSVRVCILAQVFWLIGGINIGWSILAIGALAALWAVLGGIRSIVWTNVLQCGVFVIAGIAAAIFIIGKVAGGLPHILEQADAAGKLRVFDLNVIETLELTLWTGLFGSTFNTLASHGADQMNTQQILCCRGPAAARKAMIWSSLSQLFVVLLLFIGLGLYAYSRNNPLPIDEGEGPTSRVFPIFIATVMPAGLKGLLIVGLAAAALSSLDAVLCGLSEATVHSLARPGSTMRDPQAQVHYSRMFIAFWGAVLCAMAMFFNSMTELTDLINSALRMTSFTYGALAGALIFAFLPLQRDGRGVMLSAPFAVLATFGMMWHGDWTHWIVVGGVCVQFVWWFALVTSEADQLVGIEDQDQYVKRAWYILLAEYPRSFWVLIASSLVLYLHFAKYDGEYLALAWPWYLTMGVGITLIFGYLLSRPLPPHAAASRELEPALAEPPLTR